jgi:hypothetical protein
MSLIRNSNQTKQGLDFTGIQNGKIHPSDIDAVLEFDNEALILMEVKRTGNPIPTGQRLLLERLCDSWHTNKSIVLYVTHDYMDDSRDIPLTTCSVNSCYYNKKWMDVDNEPLRIVLNKLGFNWDIDKLIFDN